MPPGSAASGATSEDRRGDPQPHWSRGRADTPSSTARPISTSESASDGELCGQREVSETSALSRTLGPARRRRHVMPGCGAEPRSAPWRDVSERVESGLEAGEVGVSRTLLCASTRCTPVTGARLRSLATPEPTTPAGVHVSSSTRHPRPTASDPGPLGGSVTDRPGPPLHQAKDGGLIRGGSAA